MVTAIPIETDYEYQAITFHQHFFRSKDLTIIDFNAESSLDNFCFEMPSSPETSKLLETVLPKHPEYRVETKGKSLIITFSGNEIFPRENIHEYNLERKIGYLQAAKDLLLSQLVNEIIEGDTYNSEIKPLQEETDKTYAAIATIRSTAEA